MNGGTIELLQKYEQRHLGNNFTVRLSVFEQRHRWQIKG